MEKGAFFPGHLQNFQDALMLTIGRVPMKRMGDRFWVLVWMGLFYSCIDTQESDVSGIVRTPLFDDGIAVTVVRQTIATGARHTCALFEKGGLKCWGRNNWGQLGNGDTNESLSPVEVQLAKRGVNSISAGKDHTCAIRDDDVPVCWGRNDLGQLGNGSRVDSFVPSEVSWEGRLGVKAISVGYDHACAILEDGSVSCWGYNSSGQLGDGSTLLRERPSTVILPKGKRAIRISAGYKHTCAVFKDNSLFCWGNNFYGQLGNGNQKKQHIPVLVEGRSGRNALSVSAGDIHTCALLTDRTLTCWGSNANGRLGNGGTANSLIPQTVKLPPTRWAKEVHVGDNHACAILDDDSLSCWGDGSNGQLGNGNTLEYHTPVSVAMEDGIKVKTLDGYFMHVCAFLNNDNLVCWGDNTEGQLGDGSWNDRLVPVRVLSYQGSRVASFE